MSSVQLPPRPRMGSPRVVVPKKDVNSHNVSTEVADNPRKGSPRVVVSRNVSTDEVYARSKDADWRHPLPVTTERKALSLLKDKWETNPTHDLPDYNGYYTSKELLTADLHDFEIYTSPFKAKKNWGKFELTSLANLDVRGRELCFDGVLSVGDSAPLAGAPGKQYVQKVPIKGYSIEGYGADDPDTIIYIQSQEASQDEKYDIWYRLRLPSARYQEFHDVFRWVTQLGKHFIDFLEAQPNGVRVGLESFRQDFYRWLIRRFHKNAVFMDWLSLHDSSDFRRSIHAHIDYLRAEAYNLSDSLLEHDLWADCMRDDHRMIKPQPVCCEKTITTPHVFECFKNRYFAKKLLPCQPSKPVQEASERRKRHLGFLPGFPQPSIQRPLQPYNLNVSSFKVGDVVGILPDESEQRLWSKSAPVVNRLWFAYVHRVEGLRLFVIWLYWPENTTISTTDYPVHNELFLSGHCNCQEGELLSTDVVAQCTVDWFATKFNTTKDFICRQKFETKNSSFVSLKQTDFNCECNEEKLSVMDRCRPGDTVYVTKPRDKLLDPVVVHDINRDQKTVMVRRLLRLKNNAQLSRKRQRSQISNNELIWTDEIFKVSFERIQRICYVRHFSEATIVSQEVPFPYNRGGAGDYWILSTEMTLKNGQAKIQFLTTPPSLFQQGPDLNAPFEKLSGLSLFSGVGNLDRGLEEAGAVEFKYSVDMSSEAIHTLRANAPHPGELKLYLGSVDDYLKAALDGKLVELIAQIGHVAVIAAGSPCPGFSTLQHDPFSDRSLRNASHVTTFCSFVDIYRPKYAFLENVVNMSATRKGYESELILQQLIACLVALGYQVQQFIMSSWMYGGPQRRSRLMLSIAAPGLTPLTPPVQTHSHPDGISLKSIGKLSTGQKFGIQEDHPTPFPYVSARQALGHLPNIGNGRVYGCIKFPDHRVFAPMNEVTRKLIKAVPLDPPGQCLQDAVRQGLVPAYLYEDRKELGRSYQRIKGDGLVPTIVTRMLPHDGRNGACVHWEYDRPLTIEEARNAQGIRPCEVIIGSPAQQMRMVGNAVDRHQGEPLGLALRRAEQQNRIMRDAGTGIGISEPHDEEREYTVRVASESMESVIHNNVTRGKHDEILGEESEDTESHEEITPGTSTDDQDTATGTLPPNSILEKVSSAMSRGIEMLTFTSARKPLPIKPKRRWELIDNHDPQHTDTYGRSTSSKRVRREINSKSRRFPADHAADPSIDVSDHDLKLVSASSLARSNRSIEPIKSVDTPSPKFSNPTAKYYTFPSTIPNTPETTESTTFTSASEQIQRIERPKPKPLIFSRRNTDKPEPPIDSKNDMATTTKHNLLNQRPALRRTRHSGLVVEFRPTAWNKRVETEVKAAEKNRRESRKYA